MAPCFIVKYPQAEGVLRWVQRLVYGNLITVKKLEAWFSVFQPPQYAEVVEWQTQ